MSPQVLVRCPPFPPCPPFFPCSPRSPPGDVYIHPRPPTPHPPSPSPPPRSLVPRPVLNQQPPAPGPVGPPVPAALLQRYLALLEYTVDNYNYM